MKVWLNTSFDGHWPVGVAAVVVADSELQAAELLNVELQKRGLPCSAQPEQFTLLQTRKPLAIILRDGEY